MTTTNIHILKYTNIGNITNKHTIQNLVFHHTPIPRVPSSEASDRTTRRRRDAVSAQREAISGGREGASRQLELEVRALSKEDRQKLLEEAGFGVEMDATQVLAIKADLAIPWYRLRILRRYMYVTSLVLVLQIQ